MWNYMLLMTALIQQPYDVPMDAKPSCKVFNSRNADQYEFVRVYELSTGRIVFQSTIRGGASKDVYVSSKQIKVEHKWAGDVAYHSPVVADCQNGVTIRI